MRPAPVSLPPRALVVPIATGYVQRAEIPTVCVQPYATVFLTAPLTPGSWVGCALDCAGAFVGER